MTIGPRSTLIAKETITGITTVKLILHLFQCIAGRRKASPGRLSVYSFSRQESTVFLVYSQIRKYVGVDIPYDRSGNGPSVIDPLRVVDNAQSQNLRILRRR